MRGYRLELVVLIVVLATIAVRWVCG